MSPLPSEFDSPLELPVDYGSLSPTERRAVREEYIRLQGGKCHHCGAPLDGEASEEMRGLRIDRSLFPEGFFKYPVHLHHSHEDGMTIGAVHNRCNAILWQYHGE